VNAPTFDIERARLVAARRLPPEHFDDFQRLAKSVVHGPPFQLVFIDCADSRYRERVIDSLGEVLRPARLRSSRLPLSERVHDAAALEARLRHHAAQAEVVHIVGAAHWFNAARWDELNQRRERLARDARARLVFWLNAEAIALLSLHGQDLWAWRSGVYAFEAQRVAPVAPTLPATNPRPAERAPDTRSMSERHRRVVELQQTLASMPPESLELRVPLVDELGRLLFDLGEYDAALAHWRDIELPLHRERRDELAAAMTMGQIADVLRFRGDLDEALRIRREDELPVYERLGDQRARAMTMGQIADILESRGELDEALRIRREEELPVYERLGDDLARAVTMGQIADVLQSRGDLDEALRIRREEELPVYERLGDQRTRALTMGKIADVLQSRGQLDEALRIRREEELPVYERLGDQRSRAVTMGQIADVLESRGQVDEALRIRREEQLPVYERLGAARERAVTLGKIADALQSRGQLDEALRIRREEELPVYERLGDPRGRAVTMGKIADVLQARGELDEAVRIRQEEELPVYGRLGARHELLIGQGNLALNLRARNRAGDRAEARRLLTAALADADQMQLPEAVALRELLAAPDVG
jgi:tetratricopeptide (TPR) repeat protein